MNRKAGYVLLLLLFGALLVSCAGQQAEPTPTVPAAIPSPATAFCLDQGFISEMRTAEDGSQYGVCIFPDGRECDEWAFFRRECPAGGP